MRRHRSLFAVVCCVLLAAGPILAFHERGHMAIALIAYRQLDEAHKLQIQAILKTHPHFAEFLAKGMPSDARADEWIVMQASVWPDWVKRNHREKEDGFNFPNHHYVNLPIMRFDGLDGEMIRTLERNAGDLPKDPSSGRILVEYPHWLAAARDPALESSKRAIALCWVLHLVGDIHQPLHAATLFTRNTPKGDLGGNLSFVKWQSKSQNLHFIWDGMAGWGEIESPTMSQFAVVDLMTRDFLQRYTVTPGERAVATIDQWARESQTLAEKEAYAFEGKPLALAFTAKMGETPASAITPALPQGYGAHARQIAERRVVLAGHRLADRLMEVAAPAPAPAASGP